MTEIEALLFDLGGVLIGLEFERMTKYWAERAACDPAMLRSRFTFDAAYEQHERGEIDSPAYFAHLRKTLGISLSDDELLTGWNDIFTTPVPGIETVLRAAGQCFPLYVLTNSNPSHQIAWSAQLQRELAYFESVFVSSELGRRKPDPSVFAEVARRVGLPVSSFLFFDDTRENIVGAEAAGMSAVFVGSLHDVTTALRELESIYRTFRDPVTVPPVSARAMSADGGCRAAE